MLKRLAKEVIYCAMGIDEAIWQESSIFEKIGRAVATMILITYTIILPALIFLALLLEG